MVVFLLLACVAAPPSASATPEELGAAPGGDVDVLFSTDTLPTFRLVIDDPDWAETLTSLIPDDACAPRPYLAADLSFENPVSGEEERWANVGVRYRGHSSLWIPNYAAGSRWGLKLSFDTFVEGRAFHEGLDIVNLLGTEGDESLLREALGLALLREADVPAPRASWARLYVNGEYLGVFPNSEEADDGAFVERRFGMHDGSLYEVSGYCGNADLAWSDDDPETYDGYHPKSNTTEEHKRRDLIPFLACASEGDEDAFAACLPTWVDVPGWLRLMAVDALLANYDGLAAAGHNYLLWFPPDGSPGVVWPYDLDLAFYADAGHIASESIYDFHPTWVLAAPSLTRRVRSVWSEAFCEAVLQEEEAVAPEALIPRVEALRERLAPEIEADPFLDAARWGEAVDALLAVARARHRDVVEEAAACRRP